MLLVVNTVLYQKSKENIYGKKSLKKEEEKKKSGRSCGRFRYSYLKKRPLS